MTYMDTKFCELCDADYDWACPECPSCVARESYYKLLEEKGDIHKRFSLAKAVIDSLPKCDRVNCKIPATRHQVFDEIGSGVEFKTYVWRCENHKTTNGIEIDKLDYADKLIEYLKTTESFKDE